MTTDSGHASDKREILRLLYVLQQAATETLVDGVTVRGPVQRSNSYKRTKKALKTKLRIESNLYALEEAGYIKRDIVSSEASPWTKNFMTIANLHLNRVWKLTFEGWVWVMESKGEADDS